MKDYKLRMALSTQILFQKRNYKNGKMTLGFILVLFFDDIILMDLLSANVCIVCNPYRVYK